MPLDFRNVNSLWASVAVETLARLGMTTAIVCPGSRSTPLTYAFAKHPTVEALPILDERSASFFALGCAKRQHRPVALVCTSGTAGANFYPAVIEAYESGVPLLIFTADRPPEMRACASGQTIDQQKLFGNFVKHYTELSVPIAEVSMLAYLRQTLASAWARSIAPQSGPIHFNCPFRDPLPPLPDGTAAAMENTFNEDDFFSAVRPPLPVVEQLNTTGQHSVLQLVEHWKQCPEGIIIAGPASPKDPFTYCKAVSQLAQQLGWPVLAEGLSPLRNYAALNTSLISTYDILLRKSERANSVVPKQVIQLGPLPISKVLRQWLSAVAPQRWIVGPGRNLDPLHGPTHFLTTDIETLCAQLQSDEKSVAETSPQSSNFSGTYSQRWITYEKEIRQQLDDTLANEMRLVESKVVWLLSKHLPECTPLFIANSMPVRDVEYFWQTNNRYRQPVFSRGANGIDGTLSTAMGLAHHNAPTVLLTGDLAFLHDTNGLLNASWLSGHLTIVLINNGGGGIFEMLPIAQFEPEFEKYFVTPQVVDFATLCKTYRLEYRRIEHVRDLINCIEVLPETGVRLLEVRCCQEGSLKQGRKQSVHQRKEILDSL
ncbi:MAG: 2-succinyl-5-enolpyruvyl-6-hydroxy-3-cyclohexene-1-carboxylic-acid synthase [Cyanobacteria bacterium J06649_5]